MKRRVIRILAMSLLLTVLLALPLSVQATNVGTHTHRWSQWYWEREPDCELGGMRFRYCLDCPPNNPTYEYD